MRWLCCPAFEQGVAEYPIGFCRTIEIADPCIECRGIDDGRATTGLDKYSSRGVIITHVSTPACRRNGDPRLAGAGLVVRGTDSNDRRRSTNRITAAGRAVLRRLDPAVTEAAKQTLGSFGRTRLTALRDLLVAFTPPQLSDLT